MKPIVFYDIDTRNEPQGSYSPNTLKTRLALNYKRLPFTTVWMKYIEIQAKCLELGVGPTGTKPDGSPYYTLPTIYDPNTDTAVTDSLVIAQYLDTTYPDTPVLAPKGTAGLHVGLETAFLQSVALPLIYLALPRFGEKVYEEDAEYFFTLRAIMFGSKLEEMAPAGSQARVEQWAKLEEGLGKAAAWIEANGKGARFVGGDEIVHADLLIASWFIVILRVLDEGSEDAKRLLQMGGGRWPEYVETFRGFAN